MAEVQSIRDLDVKGKRVFVRVDFNVPFDKNGNVSDDTRIMAAIPTILHLLEKGARVILASHLGRPKGERVMKYSLEPVAKALAERISICVLFAKDCIGDQARAAVDALEDGTCVVLENLRFHAGEEANDETFSEALASLADIYVNDAFGAAHRAHASTVGVPALIADKAAGFLMEKELEYLGEKTANPEKPFVVILGGAKVSDKIQVIDALLDKADTMLIGGGMAYTFALAQGRSIGNSISEPGQVDIAKSALAKARENGVELLLPIDNIVADEIDFSNLTTRAVKVVEGDIESPWQGVDIGPKTIDVFTKCVAKARTILWNGPMGIFEIPECSKGTFAVAEAVAANQAAISIIGGGDSVKAVKQSGQVEKVSFISTGGGASLQFLQGKELPGLVALEI